MFQRITPNRVRGRVFAALDVGCQAAVLVGLALSGTAADAFGTVALFALLGVTCVVGGLLLKWVFVKYGAEAAQSIGAEASSDAAAED